MDQARRYTVGPSTGQVAGVARRRDAVSIRCPQSANASRRRHKKLADHDLNRLKIDRPAVAAGRRRNWIAYGVVALLLVGAGIAGLKLAGPQTVETTTVVSAYPSQTYTLLNATGYVVPQRKAAVASKGQGRLEWLGVLRCLRDTGMPIARMRRYAELAREGEPTLAERLRLLTEHDEQVSERVAVLQAQRQHLQEKIDWYRSQLSANGGS